MLIETSNETTLHGFLVGAEVAANGPSAEDIANKLADSLQFVEHVGRIDVDYLGTADPDTGEVTLSEDLAQEVLNDSPETVRES